MKKTFLIFLSILISSSLFTTATFGQKNNRNKNLKKTVKKSKIKKIRIISLGVVNSKASRLVQPEFPLTAKYLGVHGTVRVSIIIDENGDVIEAKALSGHLFLIPNSLSAAKESKFKPFKLSDGNPVKISGLIYYNFQPDKLNWLELGYFSDQPDKLKRYLPTDFVSEKQLIEQYNVADIYSKKQVNETLISSIENSLISDEKSFWLFKIGICLRKFNIYSQPKSGINELQIELENLIFTSPQNLSSPIKVRLEKILEYSKQNHEAKFNSAMQNLIDSSFMFGN